MNTWQIIIGTCENHFLKAQNYPQLTLTPSSCEPLISVMIATSPKL